MASKIVEAVCAASNIPWYVLCCPQKKSVPSNIALGVCCVLSWDVSIHPCIMAQAIHRTRQNIINQTRKYRGYLSSGDVLVSSLYKEARDIFGTLVEASE
jgi:hypothetical protein